MSPFKGTLEMTLVQVDGNGKLQNQRVTVFSLMQVEGPDESWALFYAGCQL